MRPSAQLNGQEAGVDIFQVQSRAVRKPFVHTRVENYEGELLQ